MPKTLSSFAPLLTNLQVPADDSERFELSEVAMRAPHGNSKPHQLEHVREPRARRVKLIIEAIGTVHRTSNGSELRWFLGETGNWNLSLTAVLFHLNRSGDISRSINWCVQVLEDSSLVLS